MTHCLPPLFVSVCPSACLHVGVDVVVNLSVRVPMAVNVWNYVSRWRCIGVFVWVRSVFLLRFGGRTFGGT